MSAVHGWYPVDDAGRALRWRLKQVQRALEEVRKRGQVVRDPLALLTSVVCPSEDERDESLDAVREREQAAA